MTHDHLSEALRDAAVAYAIAQRELDRANAAYIAACKAAGVWTSVHDGVALAGSARGARRAIFEPELHGAVRAVSMKASIARAELMSASIAYGDAVAGDAKDGGKP